MIAVFGVAIAIVVFGGLLSLLTLGRLYRTRLSVAFASLLAFPVGPGFFAGLFFLLAWWLRA